MITGWRAALRIARREAWRHRARSLLVIALVGLPVFALSALAVAVRTYDITPGTKITRIIGTSDAWVSWAGVPVQQGPEAPYDGAVGFGSAARAGRVPSDAAVLNRLPAGSRLIDYRISNDGRSVYTRNGLDYVNDVGLDYADPLAAGMVRQLSGRAPATDGEAAVTSAFADGSGLGVGDTLRLAAPNQSLTIVGTVQTTDRPHDSTVYTLPGALPAGSGAEKQVPGASGAGWLVRTPRPLTWREVLALDKLGFVTLSRSVYLSPPPLSQQPFGNTDPGTDTEVVAAGALIGGMALLEVVLLAGPAFAVGARRRVRELGLLAAIGGARRDLRRTVLADAVVLGLTAGLVGAGFGIAVAPLVLPLFEPLLNNLPGPFSVPWLQIGGLVLLSLVTALLAAVVPAVRAGRVDPVTALAGRRGKLRSRRRWPVLGLVLAGLGLAYLLGVAHTDDAVEIVAGVAVLEVGLILCTPVLIGAEARLARWLPPPVRIALRDASRNRSAATPAVAAVMATIIGVIALAVAATSRTDNDRNTYLAALPNRDAYVDLTGKPSDEAAVRTAFATAVPRSGTTVVSVPERACGDTGRRGCVDAAVVPASGRYAVVNRSGGQLPGLIVSDGSNVDALFGAHVPQVAAALRAGHAVVQPDYLRRNGTITVRVGSQVTEVPAITTHGAFMPSVLLPPGLAERLGLGVPVAAGVLASSDTGFSVAERQRLYLALSTHPHAVSFETGYSDRNAWVPYALLGVAAFVAVFAALITTALANVDARPELDTLVAIGAGPRTRRVLTMSRAAVIAGLGCVLGVIAGVLPAKVWAAPVYAPVSLPWAIMLIAAFGIPAVAALLAGALSRSRW